MLAWPIPYSLSENRFELRICAVKGDHFISLERTALDAIDLVSIPNADSPVPLFSLQTEIIFSFTPGHLLFSKNRFSLAIVSTFKAQYS
jgi:hypothetical protein